MGDVYHRKTMRLTGYDYNTPGVYFLTICTKDRQCLLAHIKEGDVVNGPVHTLKPYGQTVKSYIEKMDALYDYLKVENYVIMPNHIHILLSIKEGPSRTPVPTLQNSYISRFVSSLKRFCNKECGGNIWQSRSYDHIIRNQTDFDVHMEYIQSNPFAWKKDEFYIETP